MRSRQPRIATVQRTYSPTPIDEALVISCDPRDPRSIAIRLSGGTAIKHCTGMTTVEVGQKVLVAMDRAKNTAVILGVLKNSHTISTSTGLTSALTPPANVALSAQFRLLSLSWDFYPGNNDVCYEVQINTTPAEDGSETRVMVTKGSYYEYYCAPGTTRSFRIRAMRWISDSNIVVSSWSGWFTGTSAALASSDLPNLANGNILIGDASNRPQPHAVSGDAALSNAGALTLGNSGVVAGSYGDATHIPVVTLDAKGRATAASTVSVTYPSPGQYRQFVYTYTSTDITFLTDSDGKPLFVLSDLE